MPLFGVKNSAMSDIMRERAAMVARIQEGDGAASREQRRAAFRNEGVETSLRDLVSKVCERAREITEDDVVAVRAAGFSEDQIFEVCVCAALGQATRQLDSALAALDAAGGGKA
jgi:alkylhydroperoxidase family enzyme